MILIAFFIFFLKTVRKPTYNIFKGVWLLTHIIGFGFDVRPLCLKNLASGFSYAVIAPSCSGYCKMLSLKTMC